MDQFRTNFWIEAHADPVITKAALRVLISVALSYMCEAGFSAVAVLLLKIGCRTGNARCDFKYCTMV